MKRRPPLRAILVVVLVIVAGSVFVYRSRAMPGPEAGVRGSGTVEATEIGVSAEVTGVIAELLVDEGDRVEAGQPIARLDDSILSADYDRTGAAVYTAQMRYADVARGARSEEVRALGAKLAEAAAALDGARTLSKTAHEAYDRPTEFKSAVDNAASGLAAARASYMLAQAQEQEAVTGPRAQEIAAGRAALEQTVATLDGAQAELAQAERAHKERAAASTQVSAAETQLAVATAGADVARSRQELVEAPPRPAAREQITQRIAGARAGVAQADSNLKRVRELQVQEAATDQELEAAVSQYDQSVAKLNEAEAALADLDAGARHQERAEAAAAVSQATASAEGAAAALGNAKHEQAILEAASRQQLERARAAVAQATHARDQAASKLDLLLAGTRDEELSQAKARVQSAEAGVQGAEAAVGNASQAHQDRFTLRQQLENTQQGVKVAEARAAAARAQLDLVLAGNTSEAIETARGMLLEAEAARDTAKARLDKTQILAPHAGTISEVVLRQGETVNPGSVVVRMLDLENMWIRVYLPVTQFGRIVAGQAAKVYSDAKPTEPYGGTVQTVADESEFTPRNTQTVEERVKEVFWVKVSVGAAGRELKPGMPADVVLETGSEA